MTPRRVPYFVLGPGLLLLLMASASAVNYHANLSHSWAMNDTINNLNVSAVYDWRTAKNYSMGSAGGSYLISSVVPDVFLNGTPNVASLLLAGTESGAAYLPYGRFFQPAPNAKAVNFTIELWVRPMHGTNDSTFQQNRPIWGQYDATTGEGGITLTRNYSNQNVKFCFSWQLNSSVVGVFKDYQLCTSNQTQTNSATASNSGINNTWFHLAVSVGTGDAGNGWATLMLNGTNVSHGDFSGPLVAKNFTQGSTSAFNFGITYYEATGTESPMSFFDEIRIWNASRTATNISRTMNLSFPTATTLTTSNFSLLVYDEDSYKLLTNVSVNQTGALYYIYFDGVSSAGLVDPLGANYSLGNVNDGRFTLTTGPLQDLGYLRRSRIFFSNNSNSSRAEKLFLVNTTVAPSFVTVSLTDKTGKALANYTVQSMRRFDPDGWLPVEDAVTDPEGEATMSFHLYTVSYQFLIRRNNTNVVLIDPMTIRQGTINLAIDTSNDPFQAFRRLGLAEPQISFDNASGNLSVIYIDPSGVMDYSTLLVQRFTNADRSTVCADNRTTSAVWMNCTVPNESSTSFLARYCLHWPNASGTGLEDECFSQELVMGSRRSWGVLGVFVGVLMIVAGVIMGILAGGLMGGLFSLVLTGLALGLTGIWPWGYGVSASALILSGLVLYQTKT